MAALFIFTSICLACCFAWSYSQYNEKFIAAITSGSRVYKSASAARKVPHIILIVLDTVRANHLSIYGDGGETPNLEELSKDSLVFENCIATSSWTIPAHASLFTGLYPIEHGTLGTSNMELKKSKFGFPLPPPLSKNFLTLAEIFKDNGYFTPAFIANNALKTPEYQLTQGFHVLNHFRTIGEQISKNSFRPLIYLFSYLTNLFPKYTLRYWTADEITNKSIRLVEKLDQSPFFLFLNYLDAHYPYAPPRPFAGKFVDSPFPQLYRLKQHFRRYMDPAKGTPPYWNDLNLTQYNSSITYLDTELGKLFSCLKQTGIYDSSLIIVTSDHGELFGEQGLFRHRTHLYEGVVKVPLVIKFPFSTKTGREKRLIGLTDIYPTILSICDLSAPYEVTGKVLGKDAFVGAQFYNNEEGFQKSIYYEKYKYMQYERGKSPELYDLEKDPLEQVNRATTLPEITRKIKVELENWEQAHGPKFRQANKAEKIQPETAESLLETLRGLGYVQ